MVGLGNRDRPADPASVSLSRRMLTINPPTHRAKIQSDHHFLPPVSHFSSSSFDPSNARTRGWARPGRPRPLPRAFKASVLKPWPLGAPRAAPEGLHLKEADSSGFWS
ncbi:hypothetical protein CROQUDRAFT_87926 [Cronartium quercuum f. sp. fusiforme G11]|uniref:Uncharacterized protein n=1 Tax=Cronartium quercuum f. sp. fusiforme G11 TaxID=708437 RepID=A0A9P6TH47_9BASI|nr:hypothetical protein CROQUDRAFT_87926 [Cronartium quercuum f. sp. fusiforme G11]